MNFGMLGALFGRLGAGSKPSAGGSSPPAVVPTYYILGF